MKITAIFCVRNEDMYLDVTLARLAASDISLAIIDNDSTDRTPLICDKYRKHIVYQSRLEFRGVFSLTEQLEAKAEVVRQAASDWFIHHDADEVLQSPQPEESLREGIERVATEGCNVINFDEFVFVPTTNADHFEYQDFYEQMLHYYFFEPRPQRLMRAWRHQPAITQANGGHILKGCELRVCPQNFILRHYPSLSLAHARQKYPMRQFAAEDLAKGWHAKRLNVRSDTIALPPQNSLKALPFPDDKDFDRSEPWKKHFWG